MSKKVACYKVKNKKTTKIRKCDQKSINLLLDNGYSVSKVTEQGNKTKIVTFSPMTREEAWREHKKKFGSIPF